MITREPYSTDSNIQIEFEGNNDEVQKAVDKYFEQFSPFGYNTRIKTDVSYLGTRIVQITRWKNCD